MDKDWETVKYITKVKLRTLYPRAVLIQVTDICHLELGRLVPYDSANDSQFCLSKYVHLLGIFLVIGFWAMCAQSGAFWDDFACSRPKTSMKFKTFINSEWYLIWIASLSIIILRHPPFFLWSLREEYMKKLFSSDNYEKMIPNETKFSMMS